MSRAVRTTPRAEGVGSLIRSPEVIKKFTDVYADKTVGSPAFVLPEKAAALADLARTTDAAVAELVRRQLDAGMDIITDGEIRRAVFTSCFFNGVEGVGAPKERPELPNPDGTTFEYLADPVPTGRLRKVRNPLVEEVATLRQLHPSAPIKVTVPAASIFLWAASGEPPSEYSSPFEMVEDVIGILQEMVAEAVAAGATNIQFDGIFYPGFDDGSAEHLASAVGITVDQLLAKGLELDAKVLDGIPDHVTTSTHICRGNMAGARKGFLLDHVAERMFAELPFDRWLIEWEDPERHGDFSSLRFVQDDQIVVLGLVSTKTPVLEDEDELVRRVEESSKFISVDQLAVSPQCGFSSGIGYQLTKDSETQWRKLELVGQVADRVWGSA
jgi:5-methyltetrahydropteroyltriglutamate--homocysteine methyltransferase